MALRNRVLAALSAFSDARHAQVERRAGAISNPSPNYNHTTLDGAVIYALNASGNPVEVGPSNPLTSGDTRTPGGIVVHRSAVAAADGTAKPANSSGLWAVNPGGRTKCRVSVTTTGSPTTCTLRPYLRTGGSTGQVETGSLQTLNGTPNFDAAFDVQADGDDLLVYVETLSGGASPTVTVDLSWR